MPTTFEAIDQKQYLTFRLAAEEYAVPILQVKEIIQYDEVTHVPRTPRWIRGVINLRGSVVPVVDLAVKFGLPPGPITAVTCIVITEVEKDGDRLVLGVVADSVCQVIELGDDDLKPAPSFGTEIDLDYLVGMGRSGSRFVLVLDIDRVLSSNEKAAAASLEAVETPMAETGS